MPRTRLGSTNKTYCSIELSTVEEAQLSIYVAHFLQSVSWQTKNEYLAESTSITEST